MPYHSYTNTKKTIVFDVYQVGIKGMYWISPTRNDSRGSVIPTAIWDLSGCFLQS